MSILTRCTTLCLVIFALSLPKTSGEKKVNLEVIYGYDGVGTYVSLECSWGESEVPENIEYQAAEKDKDKMVPVFKIEQDTPITQKAGYDKNVMHVSEFTSQSKVIKLKISRLPCEGEGKQYLCIATWSDTGSEDSNIVTLDYKLAPTKPRLTTEGSGNRLRVDSALTFKCTANIGSGNEGKLHWVVNYSHRNQSEVIPPTDPRVKDEPKTADPVNTCTYEKRSELYLKPSRRDNGMVVSCFATYPSYTDQDVKADQLPDTCSPNSYRLCDRSHSYLIMCLDGGTVWHVCKADLNIPQDQSGFYLRIFYVLCVIGFLIPVVGLIRKEIIFLAVLRRRRFREYVRLVHEGPSKERVTVQEAVKLETRALPGTRATN